MNRHELLVIASIATFIAAAISALKADYTGMTVYLVVAGIDTIAAAKIKD